MFHWTEAGVERLLCVVENCGGALFVTDCFPPCALVAIHTIATRTDTQKTLRGNVNRLIVARETVPPLFVLWIKDDTALVSYVALVK